MALPSIWNETKTNPVVLEFPEDTTHGSFLAGDLVKLHTNGKVRLATANAAVLGIAQQKYSGTADTSVKVELFNGNDVYVGTFRAAATSQALVGDLVDFVASAGAFTWDEQSATTDAYVVGLYDAASTSGRIRFRAIPGGNLMKNVL